MKKLHHLTIASVVLFATAFTACDQERNGEPGSTGTANIEVTDAAVDAENITGVYLAVNEIEAESNGEVRTIIRFDEPKTFNLMEFQNGNTLDLGDGELRAGTYSRLHFILEEGENYVEFDDGTSQELEISGDGSSRYRIDGDFDISANTKTSLVADIDLRKALVDEGDHQFRLRATARVVEREKTGTIRGTIAQHSEDHLVIYAYAKGVYSASEAAEPAPGTSGFEGSVNSAVASNGSFTLAFMEEGDYDLIAVVYEKNEAEGTMEFKSATKADLMIGGNLVDLLQVKANTNTDVLINLEL